MNKDNKSSMNPRVYFLLFPKAFHMYLKRNIDNKSSMDLSAHFLASPQAFNRYLRRNIDPGAHWTNPLTFLY